MSFSAPLLLSRLSDLLWRSTLDGRAQTVSPEIQRDIDQARERAACEMMAIAMLGQIVAAFGIYWVLRSRIPGAALLVWLCARQVSSVIRMAHSWACLKGWLPSGPSMTRVFIALATLDGLLWSALGWGLTPLFQLEVSVVTIGVLVGVCSLAAFMLYPILPAALGVIWPVMVPNAFYAAGRHDDLGYFCLASILGLTVVLTIEVLRNNRRLIELLRLRFESEQLSKVKSEALQQARLLAEAKSRFVATMSHEMRTPLHGILGLVRMARHDAHDPTLSRNLALIQGSGEHLMNVINDVLDYSKLEAGKLPVHPVPFKLHEMLSEFVETYKLTCAEKGLLFEVSLDLPPGEYVDGDATRIRQVLHNLVSNAIKFTSSGSVRLSAWRPEGDDMLCFEVRDSGIGIAEEDMPKVFDAFHQAEGTYERRYGGTGLGLTISRDLCHAMGGDLRCASQKGKGTVFTCDLRLPRTQPRRIESAADLARAERTRRGDRAFAFDLSVLFEPHVLLVEDNPVNALVAQAELARLGVRVTTVDNGPDALALLDRELVDLVLMDCEMPGMDGIETTYRIREAERQQRRPSVTIVALTASGRDVYVERCIPAGMNGYLLKPFRSEELADIVAKHVRTQLCEA